MFHSNKMIRTIAPRSIFRFQGTTHHKKRAVIFDKIQRNDNIPKSIKLLNLLNRSFSTKDPKPKNEVDIFNKQLKKYSWLKSIDGANQAIQLLTSIKQNEEIQPNITSYNLVLEAISKSSDSNAGLLAEEILNDIKNDGSVIPDVATYTNIINAYANSDEAIDKVESLLHECIQNFKDNGNDDDNNNLEPNKILYTSMINTYAKTNHHEKAIELLKEMHELHNSQTYKFIKPDIISYNAVLNAVANSTSNQKSQIAQEILKEIHALSQEDESMKPNNRTYNAVIKSIAKSGAKDAGKQAEEVLRLIYGGNDLNPNALVYTSVMEAYLNNNADVGNKIHELLNEMMTLYNKNRNKYIRPTVLNYNLAMKAYHNHNHPNKVEEILKLAMDDYKLKNNTRGKPNEHSFEILLDSWSTQKSANVIDKTYQCFDWMKSMNVQVNERIRGKIDALMEMKK